MSKRQKKKQSRQSPQVPGLVAVPFGNASTMREGKNTSDDDNGVFGIKGTVAHLKCKIISLKDDDFIDDNHLLGMAEVQDAYVHPNYWGRSKKLVLTKR